MANSQITRQSNIELLRFFLMIGIIILLKFCISIFANKWLSDAVQHRI